MPQNLTTISEGKNNGNSLERASINPSTCIFTYTSDSQMEALKVRFSNNSISKSDNEY